MFVAPAAGEKCSGCCKYVAASILMRGISSGVAHRPLDILSYSASNTAAANLDDAGGCPLSRSADQCTRPCPLLRHSPCSYAQI
jgi:hypothetical protein